MKNIAVFFILLCLSLSYESTAQTATGGCSGITVSNIPPYPTVYFVSAWYKNCKTSWSCPGEEEGCCRWLISGSPVTPRFWLERLTDQGWVTAAGPQYGASFNNLAHGTYRVKCQVPNIAENACKTDGHGNILKAKICVYNDLGQFLGWWGTWDNSPFGTTAPTYTNTVIVGNTVAADNNYTFIDPSHPPGGPNGPDPWELGYTFGEVVTVDASASTNYNQWWLAVFEDGPTYHRYKSMGWNFGTINAPINLSSWWGNGGWNFEPLHSYMVQFVVENQQCLNGSGWNNNDRTFFICPTGSVCRFGEDMKELSISPNPANSFIRLMNFEPDLGREYRLHVVDIAGRTVKDALIDSEEVDVSDLRSGMFIATLLRDGKPMFTSKLVVNRID